MSKNKKLTSPSQDLKETIPDILRVIELCAGLGGTRLGAEQLGVFKVVQASEIEPKVIQTYYDNFREVPLGDFSKIPISEWADCEVIAASLPCQSFSSEGNKLGTEDERGALIFNFIKMVKAKKPLAIFLENVTGLANLEEGKHLNIFLNLFRSVGYFPHYKIIKSSDHGVAQARERVYICAFNKNIQFEFPEPREHIPNVASILEESPHQKYFLNQTEINHLKLRKEIYKSRGHGFGFKVLALDKPSRTLLKSSNSKIKNLIPVPAQIGAAQSGHGVIDLPDENNKLKKFNLRYLTPRECGRLQGFPEDYKFTGSDSDTYAQLGNAVSVPVIRAIFKEIYIALKGNIENAPETSKKKLEVTDAHKELVAIYDLKFSNAKNDIERKRLEKEFRIKAAKIRLISKSRRAS